MEMNIETHSLEHITLKGMSPSKLSLQNSGKLAEEEAERV